MSGAVFTGAGLDLFRLTSIKGQLELEERGLRSSGGPLRPRLAKEFGLPPRAARAKYIAAVDQKIEEARARLQPGDIKEF